MERQLCRKMCARTAMRPLRCVQGLLLDSSLHNNTVLLSNSLTATPTDVEEITAKTGSFKRFPVFVKMLLSALRQESDSVFVDLLSYGDLELLRSKRGTGSSGAAAAGQQQQQQLPAAQQHQQQQQQTPPPTPPTTNKRYLILTYAAEFDRVHYPLPLQFEEHPDPRRLKATIRQLRAQLAAAAQPRVAGGLGRRAGHTTAAASSLSPELKQLREQNAALQAQVRALDAAQQLGGAGASSGSLAADVQQLTADAQETVHDLRALRRERDGLLQRLQQAEAALEGERNLHRRELRRRAKDAADAGAELAAAKDQIRELRLKCRELVQELDLAQRRAKVAGIRWVARGAAGGSVCCGSGAFWVEGNADMHLTADTSQTAAACQLKPHVLFASVQCQHGSPSACTLWAAGGQQWGWWRQPGQPAQSVTRLLPGWQPLPQQGCLTGSHTAGAAAR